MNFKENKDEEFSAGFELVRFRFLFFFFSLLERRMQVCWLLVKSQPAGPHKLSG